MLQEADSALRGLLLAGLPDGTVLSFAAPDRSWTGSAAPAGTLDVFLYQVREDLQGRSAWWNEVRDQGNRVVERQAPVRRYRAWYLVTAWCGDVAAEHALLDAALDALARHDIVPAEHLTGSLAGSGYPVQLQVAPPELPPAAPDIWTALGTGPRTALDLVVTLPLVPAVRGDIARRPDTIDLGVDGRYARPPDVRPDAQRPMRRIREGT